MNALQTTRYSLTIKPATTREEIITKLQQLQATHIYITQTQPNTNPIPIANELKRIVTDIILVISTKYYSSLDEISAFIHEAQNNKLNKFLIVSGYPKTQFDSVTVFNNLQTTAQLFCAYNPYGPDRDSENNRLLQKVKNPSLKGIFLQIGIDLNQLETGIKFIKTVNPSVHIEGCILEPTRATRERLRTKPIHGIYLNKRYFEDQAYADEITQAIREMYQEYGISEIREDFTQSLI